MLLIIGYDETRIESIRSLFRKSGFPTMGCTCRNLRLFPFLNEIDAVFFPFPESRARTEYVFRPFHEACPDISLFIRATDSFTEDDVKSCKVPISCIPATKTNSKLVKFFQKSGVLFPRCVRMNGIYRHALNEKVLIFGMPFLCTPSENTLLTYALLHPDGIWQDQIIAACFSLLTKADHDAVSDLVSRLNKRAVKEFSRPLLSFSKEKGYSILG